MKSYLYILGKTPDLAFIELQSFLPDVRRIRTDVAISDHFVAIEKLGGTIKIAEVASEPVIGERSTFGMSVYGGPQVSIQTLDSLKKQYHAARFVATRGEPLSSVVIAKNKLQEIIVVKHEGGSLTGNTIAVQDFESWNQRDYGRPHADPKAGMLPPKVSRMAVNVADRSRDARRPLTQKTLLDPFCGMGTVLAEALVMGWNVMGTDQSTPIIEKCRANLRWLTEKHQSADGVTYRLQAADAVHASDAIDAGSIDAIVTEPFMGDTNIANHLSRVNSQDVKNIIKGLEKLYIGCLKDWRQVLKPRGVVMMALPMYAIAGKTYFVKKVIDMCEMLGYTIQAGPIEYSRPQAVVRRQFYLFKKNS